MGLSINDVFEIVKKMQCAGVKNASLCMMGKQDIENVSWSLFIEKVKAYGFIYDIEIAEKIRDEKRIDSYKLFKMFGFSEVFAMDYSDYEGADIIFDLNSDILPDNLKKRFDFVINGGTLEHVFNQATALKNMSEMVRVGGIIYHLSPLTGWVNHGFYSVSPTLFMDYYMTNHWQVEQCDMITYKKKEIDGYRGKMYSQDVRLFDSTEEINRCANEYGTLSLVRCIAKRNENSVTNSIPIQGAYLNIYRTNEKNKIVNWKKVVDFCRNNQEKCIYAFGVGYQFDKLIEQLYIYDMENVIDGVFDSNVSKAGTSHKGYRILFPTVQKLKEADAVLVTTLKYEDEILAVLKDKNVDREKIYMLSEFAET